MNNDKMNKIIGVLVSVLLVLVLLPQATTSTDDSTYDPLADVNRDGVVDVEDLYRVGQAYGSSQILPFQQNKTVVYVYQLESDPPEVQNVRVAIAELPLSYDSNVVQVGYTSSSGIANFTLSPNTDYTAIAWSNKTYNYANFTTNEFGESSVILQLGYPHLPPNCVFVNVINATSGAFVQEELSLFLARLYWNTNTGQWDYGSEGGMLWCSLGAVIVPPQWGVTYQGQWFVRVLVLEVNVGFTPDENGSAFVVIYV